jgi:hypothetical protein
MGCGAYMSDRFLPTLRLNLTAAIFRIEEASCIMKAEVVHSLFYPKERNSLFHSFTLMMEAVFSVSYSEGGGSKGHSYTQQMESLSFTFLS